MAPISIGHSPDEAMTLIRDALAEEFRDSAGHERGAAGDPLATLLELLKRHPGLKITLSN